MRRHGRCCVGIIGCGCNRLLCCGKGLADWQQQWQGSSRSWRGGRGSMEPFELGGMRSSHGAPVTATSVSDEELDLVVRRWWWSRAQAVVQCGDG